MPFYPKNAPAFYTAMIQTLREEWLILFAETKNSILIVNPPAAIICDDKIIMDDILLFLTTTLIFFIISHVSPKYLLSIGYHLSSLNVTFPIHG